MGLTNSDLTSIKQNKNVKHAVASHMVTLQKSRNQVVSVYNYQKQTKLDKLKLVSGKLPVKNNQIVLDNKAKKMATSLETLIGYRKIRISTGVVLKLSVL